MKAHGQVKTLSIDKHELYITFAENTKAHGII